MSVSEPGGKETYPVSVVGSFVVSGLFVFVSAFVIILHLGGHGVCNSKEAKFVT